MVLRNSDIRDSLEDNFRRTLVEWEKEISGIISGAQISPNFSDVNKGYFNKEIRPLLDEINQVINYLKNVDLEIFILSDLRNLIACFSDIIRTKIIDISIKYIGIVIKVQADADTAKALSDEMQELHHKFFYETDTGISPDWTTPLFQILGRKNYLYTLDLMNKADECRAYNIQNENLYRDLVEDLKKIEKLREKTESLFNAAVAKVDGDRFRIESFWNLGLVVLFIALIVALLFFEYHKVIVPLEWMFFSVINMNDNQFYITLMKMSFFGLFSMTIFAALLKALAIFLHNYIINREKSAALYTYDKFFKEGNNPIATPVATIELIKTVLGPRNTGVIKEPESDSSQNSQIVDLLKSIIEAKK